MISDNYFSENKDLLFIFNDLIEWPPIIEACEGNFGDAVLYEKSGDERYALAPASIADALDFYKSFLKSAGEITGTYISPRSAQMEQNKLQYSAGAVTVPAATVSCFESSLAAGLVPYKSSRRIGGPGLPVTVHGLVTELFARADLSFAMTIGLLNVCEVINRYASPDLREKFASKMATGEYLGGMALTEPDHGSDLSSVRSRAIRTADGTYRLNGTKRFISQACGLNERPAILLTLARTGRAGARGLSLFIVNSKEAYIAGIENKLGIHASPTCDVVLDQTPGHLVGEEGLGLVRYAMSMMNDARISVAALSVGTATAAYMEAQKYASERTQFGQAIASIPAVRRMLDWMEREILAMRLLTTSSGQLIDLYLHETVRLESSGLNDRAIRSNAELREFERLANLLTPMAKYYCSEMAFQVANASLQVHGGAGYTEDYDIARIFRDTRILSIYEGTSQLQVVAAIGGIISGLNPGGIFQRYLTSLMADAGAETALSDLQRILRNAVSDYRKIEDPARQAYYAQDVVEIAIRFVNSILFFQAAQKSGSGRYLRHRDAYLVDSMGKAQASLIRLQIGVPATEYSGAC